MKKNIFQTSAILALAAIAFASCDDFLDKVPDNRAELDSEEKIKGLLVSAYPTSECIVLNELMSDNINDMGESNPYTERYYDQVASWTDVTETNFSDPEEIWSDYNGCVETANTVLEAIDKLGKNEEWSGYRAEALLCRAFANFILVNCFAQHYSADDNTSLGITIVTKPETTLNPQYERQTVKECYAAIQADIEEALPLVKDVFDVPKYHFNKNAAYAFATRFYLYSEQWEKAIESANKVLGTNPRSILRDNKAMTKLPDDEKIRARHYASSSEPANLMLLTCQSESGVVFGPWAVAKRYAHDEYIGTNETVDALAALWGKNYSSFYYTMGIYNATNVSLWSKNNLPYIFEYTDAVAGIGHPHSVYCPVTSDEVLLCRAESQILLGKFDEAAADMTLWMQNIANTNLTLTPAKIVSFINGIDYSYDTEKKDSLGMESTLKKHLNPKFHIDEEGSTQECMLQLVLAMRRYETLNEGKRWFDIKRYGIVIPRRTMDAADKPAKVTDWLTVDDPRRAMQIPLSIRMAGYTPNPR